MKTKAEEEAEAAAIAKSEADLWAWYLEWSQIARVAITQRSLLKEMGFLSSRKSSDEDEDVDPVTGIVRPVTPAAPVSPNV